MRWTIVCSVVFKLRLGAITSQLMHLLLLKQVRLVSQTQRSPVNYLCGLLLAILSTQPRLAAA
jgi:hypothetical protein